VSAEPIVVAAPRIRAVFEKAADRWIHRIELTNDKGTPIVILRSMEGAVDETWPLSPAIQHLESHAQPDGTSSAIGLGMSGRNHWSLSCRALPHSSADASGPWFWYLQFEIACRFYEMFDRLGSAYHVVPEARVSAFPNRLTYRCRDGEWGAATTNPASIRDVNQTLRIDVFGGSDRVVPNTIQWLYQFNRVRISI
jgi:hypothetical protein